MRNGTQTTRNAVILPFPARGEAADQERLRRALAGLDEAMTRQRRAVGEWQAALAGLRRSVEGLDGAMRAHHRALGELAGDVAGLRRESARLQAWGEVAPG